MDLHDLAPDEFRALSRQVAAEEARRQRLEYAQEIALVTASAADVQHLDAHWHEQYQGSLLEDPDNATALKWLWAGTVIAHEAQHDSVPTVGHVADAICRALAGLLLAGGGCDPADLRDLAEKPSFGGRGCSCTLYDDGGPESGPSLAVDISEHCPRHAYLLENEPPDWVSVSGTVEYGGTVQPGWPTPEQVIADTEEQS